LIFLDTNVVSETLRIGGSAAVDAWLAKHDEELAISTIVLAELQLGIEKSGRKSGRRASILAFGSGGQGSPVGSSHSRKGPRSNMACSSAQPCGEGFRSRCRMG
jgi:predicted nucleic acid-binding protein